MGGLFIFAAFWSSPTANFLRQVYLKKTLSLLFLLTSVSANAQNNEAKRPSFDRSNSIGIAVGIQPVRNYAYVAYSPALILNYEHTTVNMLGPGFLSMGAEFGIYSFNSDYHRGRSYKKVAFAVRAIYHLTILKGIAERLDPYGGFAGGLYSSPYEERNAALSSYGSAFLAPFIGVKYNLIPNLGLWAEGGTDITYLKLGINFNF
jgi:hypothetical protein